MRNTAVLIVKVNGHLRAGLHGNRRFIEGDILSCEVDAYDIAAS